ncbi:hypothetical protein MIR68_006543 [Amoeboaphelidium protococcarum]|nr:hypothetical protein MIR68_006543 [Amoeboaphelidium protococcarum]
MHLDNKVFDDKLSCLRVSPLLSDALNSVSADVEYVNLEQNFLVYIQPVAEFTPGTPKVKLINLRFNRIDESEQNWEAIVYIANHCLIGKVLLQFTVIQQVPTFPGTTLQPYTVITLRRF